MQISVTGPPELASDQVRTYAEYRVFAALARFGRLVERAAITFEREGRPENTRVVCLIDVETRDGRRLHSRGSASHATEAVDWAAERVRRALLPAPREVSV